MEWWNRYVKTIEEHLRKVVFTYQRDWVERLRNFLLAYRATTHETTGVTPANMVFGRELGLPCDLIFLAPPDKEQSTTDSRPGRTNSRHPPLRSPAPESGLRQDEDTI